MLRIIMLVALLLILFFSISHSMRNKSIEGISISKE